MVARQNEESLLRIISDLVAFVSNRQFQSDPVHLAEARLDGWTLIEWKDWGKQKTSIASKVCRENGALKERIACLDHDMAKLYIETSLTDPLTVNDPWPGASPLGDGRLSFTEDQYGDAWAEWKIASMLENTSQAAVEFEFMPSVGTWFGLPPPQTLISKRLGESCPGRIGIIAQIPPNVGS